MDSILVELIGGRHDGRIMRVMPSMQEVRMPVAARVTLRPFDSHPLPSAEDYLPEPLRYVRRDRRRFVLADD